MSESHRATSNLALAPKATDSMTSAAVMVGTVSKRFDEKWDEPVHFFVAADEGLDDSSPDEVFGLVVECL